MMDAQQIVAVVQQTSPWERAAAIVAVISGIAGLLTVAARVVRRARGE